MSLRDNLIHEFPLIRRYARALTGSQFLGDCYVRQMLEVILAEPRLLGPASDLPMNLYRLFHRIECNICLPGNYYGAYGDSDERHLRDICPLHRQVLLLVSLQGFSITSVAHILQLSVDAVERNLVIGHREMADEGPRRILVIEQVSLPPLNIAAMLAELGHSIVGIVPVREDSFVEPEFIPPELVVADIHLSDRQAGIDAVRDILFEHTVPVVFVSAHPERFLTGSGIEPVFLVDQPFNLGSIDVAISQALFSTGCSRSAVYA